MTGYGESNRVRYRTIVADPPWPYEVTTPRNPRCGDCGRLKFAPDHVGCNCSNPTFLAGEYDMPYPTMTIEAIQALPVARLSEPHAHLYLWTTNRYLRTAYAIAECWGFEAKKVLVWNKPPKGLGRGWVVSTEFCLYCTAGHLATIGTHLGTGFHWPRGMHSQKPDAFLDLVETVSPGPYLELFARRQRLGWDTWGDEALEHVEMGA